MAFPDAESMDVLYHCPECGALRVNMVMGSVCPNGHGKIFPKIPWPWWVIVVLENTLAIRIVQYDRSRKLWYSQQTREWFAVEGKRNVTVSSLVHAAKQYKDLSSEIELSDNEFLCRHFDSGEYAVRKKVVGGMEGETGKSLAT